MNVLVKKPVLDEKLAAFGLVAIVPCDDDKGFLAPLFSVVRVLLTAVPLPPVVATVRVVEDRTLLPTLPPIPTARDATAPMRPAVAPILAATWKATEAILF